MTRNELIARIKELETPLDAPKDYLDVLAALNEVQASRTLLGLAGQREFSRLLAKHADQYQRLLIPVHKARAVSAA